MTSQLHRIKGAQAPDVNNGQAANSNFTLGVFDAIILLTDRITMATPAITGVSMADRSPGITQNGWIAIEGTNLAPPLCGAHRLLSRGADADFSSRLPFHTGPRRGDDRPLGGWAGLRDDTFGEPA
jgi:hypothetical protein